MYSIHHGTCRVTKVGWIKVVFVVLPTVEPTPVRAFRTRDVISVFFSLFCDKNTGLLDSPVLLSELRYSYRGGDHLEQWGKAGRGSNLHTGPSTY